MSHLKIGIRNKTKQKKFSFSFRNIHAQTHTHTKDLMVCVRDSFIHLQAKKKDSINNPQNESGGKNWTTMMMIITIMLISE